MNKDFLIGEQVRLRAVEPEDLEIMYRIENSPELWEVSNFTVPYSRFVLKQYLESCRHDLYADKQLRLMIVGCEEDRVIGTVDLSDYVPLHGRASVGIALLKSHRGKGYGKEALGLLSEYVFRFLRLKQLYAVVSSSNKSSRALFTACGFREIACLEQWLNVGGEWEDALLFQLINNEV